MGTDTPPTLSALLDELPRLRDFTRLLSADRAQADDLFQDSLERAVRSYHRLDRSVNLRAWLFSIARNRHVDLHRRELHRPDDEPLDAVEQTLPGPADAGTDVFLGDLERAFAALPECYREVLWLVCVEGFRYEETAEVLAVPLGTVRSRLHRARRLLGDALLPRDAPGEGGERR